MMVLKILDPASETLFSRLSEKVRLAPNFFRNSAVVLDGIVLLARFRFPERQGEEQENMAFFQRLRRQYAVQRIITMPEGVFFEGAGDAIWDLTRQSFWTGYGPRSSLQASAVIARTYGKPVHPLKLVDPRFYHLDTCLCVLPGGEALHFPAAFDADGRSLLQKHFGKDLIEVPEADALKLAANAFPITPNDVVFGSCSTALEGQLNERGYIVHRVNLGSFARSGGSAFCLTLTLDARSA